MTRHTDKTTFDRYIKKPCVVYFYTSVCPVCRRLSLIFEEVSEQRGDIAFYKVNLDDDITLAERYDITHVPTLVLFKGGEPIVGHTGFLDAERLAEFVQYS